MPVLNPLPSCVITATPALGRGCIAPVPSGHWDFVPGTVGQMKPSIALPAQSTADSTAALVLGHTASSLQSIGVVLCVCLCSMSISRKAGETEKSWVGAGFYLMWG